MTWDKTRVYKCDGYGYGRRFWEVAQVDAVEAPHVPEVLEGVNR